MLTVRRITCALAGLTLLLAASGLAHAADFSADKALAELKGVGKLLLGMVFLGFLIAGGYVIVQALVDAKKQGGWGHFVVGVFMVLIGGFALWTLMTMAGQDPTSITNSIQIK